MVIKGKITAFDGKELTIKAPFCDTPDFLHKLYDTVEILMSDGRSISYAQRGKIMATIAEIAIHTGYTREEMADIMKADFVSSTAIDWFSLADTDMTTANDFLDYLIAFVVANGIPTKNPLERCADIAKFLYACLANKKCCLCGKPADLHHVDAVGMGRNRTTIMHKGMAAIALCRVHHGEAEQIGWETFKDKYHVFTTTLDDRLCEIHKLRSGL